MFTFSRLGRFRRDEGEGRGGRNLMGRGRGRGKEGGGRERERGGEMKRIIIHTKI